MENVQTASDAFGRKSLVRSPAVVVAVLVAAAILVVLLVLLVRWTV